MFGTRFDVSCGKSVADDTGVHRNWMIQDDTGILYEFTNSYKKFEAVCVGPDSPEAQNCPPV